MCAGGTQTVLTFPFAYDLEKLLAGTAFCFTEDDNIRDISNSSLRRKLFGQPDRQVGGAALCCSHPRGPPAKVASGRYERGIPRLPVTPLYWRKQDVCVCVCVCVCVWRSRSTFLIETQIISCLCIKMCWGYQAISHLTPPNILDNLTTLLLCFQTTVSCTWALFCMISIITW